MCGQTCSWVRILLHMHMSVPFIHPSTLKKTRQIIQKERGSHIFFGRMRMRGTLVYGWFPLAHVVCGPTCIALESVRGWRVPRKKEIWAWRIIWFKFIETLHKLPINLKEYTEHTLHYYYYYHHQMESTCSRLELETLGSRRISLHNIHWHGFQILHRSGSESRGPSPLMKLRNGLSISSDGKLL